MAQTNIERLTEALEGADAALRHKIDELSLVGRIGEAVSRHTAMDALAAEVTDVISEAVLATHVALYRADEAGTLHLEGTSKVFEPVEFPASMEAEFMTEHLEQSRVVEVAAPGDARPFPREVRSWMIMPLMGRESVRGFLFVGDREPGALSPSTELTLSMIAPQISSAMAGIQLWEDLRASEAKYRTFVERMQDAVCLCTRDLEIVDANLAARNMFPGTRSGMPVLRLFTSTRTAGAFRSALASSGAVQNFEAKMAGGDSPALTVLIDAVDDGQRVSIVVRDVTEQTHLAKQLMRTQKMESIGTLASGIAHDFNNILGIILPTAELLQRDDTPARRENRLRAIIEASRRGGQLTRQLLMLARDETPSSEVLQLNDVVRATHRLLSETLERTVVLELDLEETLPKISADENELAQMLINMAVNARDAMAGAGSITFRTRAAENGVSLSVCDNGPGIEESVLDKIFDPFFTTKKKGHGTGLGLSMVYGTVQRHGGTIDVRTSAGTGTEFLIQLPAAEEAAPVVPRNGVAAGGGFETILVVDDEPFLLELMEASLTALGYPVVTASNGQEALDRLGPEIDLVILDMIMPVMDGLKALELIRDRRPDAKVVIASGYTAPERQATLEVLGVQAFLPKPFPLNQLAETVRDVLDGVAA